MTQATDPRRSGTDAPPHELWRKLEKVRFAMLATRDAGGELTARPITTQQAEDAGVVWFFVSATGGIAEDLARDGRVVLTYADTGDNFFAALRGNASLVDDRAKVRELWNVMAQAWFPGGPDDPQLALLKVDVHTGEYWDSAGRVVPFFSMLKAAMTHTTPKHAGEHRGFRT